MYLFHQQSYVEKTPLAMPLAKFWFNRSVSERRVVKGKLTTHLPFSAMQEALPLSFTCLLHSYPDVLQSIAVEVMLVEYMNVTIYDAHGWIRWFSLHVCLIGCRGEPG